MIVQAGHRIGVLSADARIHFAMHAAAANQGFVVVPLPMRDPPEEIMRCIQGTGVDVLMADVAHGALAKQVRCGLPTLLVDENADPVDHLEGELRPASAGPDDLCVLRTSGTSGTPSFITITRTQISAHRRAAIQRLGCTPDSVWLAALPMWHVGGVALLDRCLHGGGRLVIQDGFDATQTAAALAAHPITHISLVPTMLRRLLEQGVRPPTSLQCVLVGGDRLPPALAREALEAGWPVFASYGLSEACSQVATATPDELRAHPGTCGRPLGGVDVTIEGASGPLQDGNTGQIVVRGSTVCGGEVRTGDHGRMVGGMLYIDGRTDDRIVSGGENVDVVRVEQLLEGIEGIDEAAVIGVPDPEWGQRVVAYYAGVAEEAAVAAAMKAQCAPHERPKELHRLEALPRSGSKLKRAALRARHA